MNDDSSSDNDVEDVPPEGAAPMIRVILVEDHASLRDALASVLEFTDGMAVAGQIGAADEEALEQARQMAAHADVAVIDLDLPGGSGIDVVRTLMSEPAPPGCVVLTGLRDDRELGLAIETGAAAVLHKSTPMPELLDVIRQVAAGQSVLPAAQTSRRLQALAADRAQHWRGRLLAEQITSRENEVLSHLVYGLDNAAIAEELVLSPDTVKTHVKNLMGKLQARSRLEAVSIALQHGLVEPPATPSQRGGDLPGE